VGDVMYDAARHFGARAEAASSVLPRLRLQSGEYVLATIHRAENTDDPQRLEVILGGLGRVAETTPVVFPVHPRTRAVLQRQRPAGPQPARLVLTEPVGYLDMLQLEKNACLVVTDSGGVQKEAFFFEKPCVTLREETEWVELVELGWNRVVPPRNPDQLADAIRSRIGSRGVAAAPYGDGTASQQIAAALQEGGGTA
jgi:UDP-GlcNAc3NAcA epimerase